jgi:hypothetical protein
MRTTRGASLLKKARHDRLKERGMTYAKKKRGKQGETEKLRKVKRFIR